MRRDFFISNRNRTLERRMERAQQRRDKVRALFEKGKSVPDIADEVGAPVRTVYSDINRMGLSTKTRDG